MMFLLVSLFRVTMMPRMLSFATVLATIFIIAVPSLFLVLAFSTTVYRRVAIIVAVMAFPLLVVMAVATAAALLAIAIIIVMISVSLVFLLVVPPLIGIVSMAAHGKCSKITSWMELVGRIARKIGRRTDYIIGLV